VRALVIGQGAAAERRSSILTALGIRPSRTVSDVTTAPPLPDAAFVCAPIEARASIAVKLLTLGVPGIFIEQPMASSMVGLDQLKHAAQDHIVMTGCNLRFAYDLPFFRWALIDIAASKPKPVRIPGLRVQPSEGTTLDNAIHELDLAYAVNGPIQSVHTICERAGLKIGIEHANMAWSNIELDWSSPQVGNCAVLSAFDDGGALHVPHEPKRVTPVHHYVALRAETAYYLNCVLTTSPPCSNVEDGMHVLQWTLVAATCVSGSSGRAAG
jgi:predicted dehydrogenase